MMSQTNLKNRQIFILNPLASDKSSAVRGLGRFTKVVISSLNEAKVVSKNELSKLSSKDSLLIFPYINWTTLNLFLKRYTDKQVLFIHDLIPLKYPQYFPKGIKGSFFYKINRFLFNRNIDFVITDTNAVKQEIVSILGFPEEKVFVAYPGVDPVFFKQEFKAKQDFCLYVGDATFNKNLPFMARLVKQAGVKLYLVGKVWESLTSNKLDLSHPEMRSLKEFSELISGSTNFKVVGFVSDLQLRKLYAEARLNILVSLDEGFGYSTLEAGLQRTASLISDIPVFKEVVGDCAVYVNPLDLDSAVSALKDLYYNDNLNSQIAEKIYKRAQRFTVEKFGSQLRQIIKRL
ncbi:MAG: hypothetical protein KatS3mg090_0047 [Patescibacteria group bacterium]|nr:MAG: hypothetical protein KatS3mg090_0047 [Patescibacteria group bacterium]